MVATDMTSSGSTEEKLRWAFKMYDKDESGKMTRNRDMEKTFFWLGVIELREMVDIVGTIYELQGFPVVEW